jgi:hypothetical protein
MNTFDRELQDLVVDISKIYNKVVFVPLNLQEEKERVRKELDRPVWKYIEVDLKEIKNRLLDLQSKVLVVEKERYFFDIGLQEIRVSSLNLVKCKIKILDDLMAGIFVSDEGVRQDIFNFGTDINWIKSEYNNIFNKKDLLQVSAELQEKNLTPEETKSIMEERLSFAVKSIESLVYFPEAVKRSVFEKARVSVKIVEDPSILFKCTADPVTKQIDVLISSVTNYSRVLIEFGILHEFGHALDSILFDMVLIPEKDISPLYSWAGVSTPNVYDMKAEVFADNLAKYILGGEYGDLLYRFRVELWLITRSLADYMYHFEKKSFKECMKVFEDVGLGQYAFEEVMSISMFVSGQRGSFSYAHRFFKEYENHFSHSKDYLSFLLYSGKTPAKDSLKFVEQINKFYLN